MLDFEPQITSTTATNRIGLAPRRLGLVPNIRGWHEFLLVDTRLAQGREQDEMFTPAYLYVYVLVVIPVHSRHGARVTDPHVDGVWVVLKRDTGKRDAPLDLREEADVFMAEIVILCV